MRNIKRLFSILLVGFILGIHDGRISLWKDGSSTPAEVFPYRAELLPEADRKALEKGIRINSSEDLIRLLEDYLS